MPRPPGGGRRGGGGRGGGGGGGGGAGGGGGGVRIGGVYADATFDPSGFQEGVEQLNAAGQVAAQRQQAYVQQIQRSWQEATAQGRATTAGILEIAAAVMRMGGSFETASQAVGLATRGSVAAREAMRDLQAQVQGVANAAEQVRRTQTGAPGGMRREQGSVFQDARGRYMQQTERGPRFMQREEGELATGRATTAAAAERSQVDLQANLDQQVRASELKRRARQDIKRQIAQEAGEPDPEEEAERKRQFRQDSRVANQAAREDRLAQQRYAGFNRRYQQRRGVASDFDQPAGPAAPAPAPEGDAETPAETDFRQRIQKRTLEGLAARDVRNQTLREQGERVPGEGGGRGGVQGFIAANQTAIRLAAGLAGIPLGINIIAGAARNLHQVIQSLQTAFDSFQSSVHELGVQFGQSSQAEQQFASAQARQQPVFDANEIQQSVSAVNQLTKAYQLTGDQQNLVSSQAQELARINSQPGAQLPALTGRLTQALSQGGAVPELGVDLSAQYLERVGLHGQPVNLQAMTVEEQYKARQAVLQQELDQQRQNQAAAGQTPGQGTPQYEANQTRAAAVTTFEQGLGKGWSDVGTWVAQRVTDVVQANAPVRAQQDLRNQAAQNLGIGQNAIGLPTRNGQTLLNPVDIYQSGVDLMKEMDRLQEQQALDAKDSAAAQARLTQELEQQVPLEDRLAGARAKQLTDIQTHLATAQQASQAATLSRGPEFASAGPEAREAVARATAEAAARNAIAAQQTRQTEGPAAGNAYRQSLVQAVQVAQASQLEGHDSKRVEAAQRILDLYDRQLAAAEALGQVEQAMTFAEIARGQAQSGIEALAISQRMRLYSVDQSGIAPADAMAQAHVQVLQAQRDMAPLQLRQLDVQHDISVAGRTNLDTQRNLLQTQLDSLAATERMEDIEHGLNQNRAEAAALTARQLQGERVDPGQFVTLMRSTRDLVLQQAIAGPAAEQARYAVTAAQRPETREQLAAQLRVNALQGEQRVLEDQTYAAQRRETVAQQIADDIQRQLDIQKAQEQPLDTILQRSLAIADATKLTADNAQRYGQFLQAGGQPGQDPLALAQQRLQGAPQLGANVGNVHQLQAPSLPLYLGRGRDFYASAATAAAAVENGGVAGPPAAAAAAVPVVGGTVPTTPGGLSITVQMPNATINNMDDIEKAARDGANKTYEQLKSAMIQAFSEGGGTVSPSLSGAGGG